VEVITRDRELAELRRLAESFPDDARYPLKIGDVMLKLGRTDEAVASYERAAAIYERTGFKLKVVAVANTILRLDPTRTEVRFRYARAMFELQLWADAVAEMTRVRDEYATKNDDVGLRIAQQELDRFQRAQPG